MKLWDMSTLDVGFCTNNGRVYNGSCYFIESLSGEFQKMITNGMISIFFFYFILFFSIATDNNMEDIDDWRDASAKYCNNNNNGHLLAIETEDEKNFITGEFLLSGLGRISY